MGSGATKPPQSKKKDLSVKMNQQTKPAPSEKNPEPLSQTKTASQNEIQAIDVPVQLDVTPAS